jgi:ribosomal-protein-alanine N-acetyltransferase
MSARNLQLETTRLRLRPCAGADLDALHALFTDPGVRRFLWDDRMIAREEAARVIEASVASFASHGFGQWLAFPREGDALVGFSGLRSVEGTPDVELLYALDPAHWGRGLAQEAARAVLQHGFTTVGLLRILARADAPNAASIRVMERLGMRFERRGLEHGLDTVCYALAREDFDPEEGSCPSATSP